jgi:membrane fusion protein (multidrug efflux system)
MRICCKLVATVAFTSWALACSPGGGALPHQEEPALPVRSLLVASAPFEPAVTLLGVVGPAHTATVMTPVQGTLHYPPRFAAGLATGARVKAGEPLAIIRNLEQELRLGEAKLIARGTDEELTRAQRGSDLGILPRADLDRAKVQAEISHERLTNARKDVVRLELDAPFSGRLVVHSVWPPGSEVSPQTLLAEVVDDARLRVEAQAAAVDLRSIRPGLTVRFQKAGGGPVLGAGKLTEVAPVVDTAGTARVIAEVTENRAMPGPGEGIELAVLLDRRPAAITLPEEALVATGAGSAVYVLTPSADRLTARLRPVVTGGRAGGRVEIVEGLAVGDRVAVGGVAILHDGAAVTAEAASPEAPADPSPAPASLAPGTARP